MKKTFIGLSIAASLLAAGNYQIGMAGGRAHVNKSQAIDNYDFLNFRFGALLHKYDALRLEFEKSGKVLNGASLKRALLNYEYDFKPESKLSPYYFIGAGYQWVRGDYKNALVADMGLGLKYKITDQFNVFSEFRGLRDYRNINNHYSGIFGFAYNFGGNTQTPVQEPQETVKTKPADSDHDGVPDYLDKCPNTPAGVKVDKNGCPVSFNFNIEFDTNSAVIKLEYMPAIKKFAEFLKQNSAYKAKIQGYTDNTGSRVYNIVLSQKRAKAVYDALIKFGIDKNRLSWEGFGPADPIASNDTPKGRAENRRVVAKLSF